MYINFCGINRTHNKTFLISRPNGSGDNLFIYTRTPFILTSEGKMGRYPAETTVFFRKGAPQYFMPAGNIYANDYIHFGASDEEMAFIDSLNIPSGIPFTGLDSTIFLNIQRYICFEHQMGSRHEALSIDLLLRYFLIKLSQAIEEAMALSISHSTKNAMNELRTGLFSHPEHHYTVESLASSVGLSASYFQSVYKKMFGRSCMNDIIQARLGQAQNLLLTTDLSVSAIAHTCGYENEAHFSRQFKKYNQVTPSEFRNRPR